MEHVIIAWGTVLVTALLLFWIFQVITRFIKHQQISQLDFFDGFLMITLLIGSAASIYTLAQIDGNYFILVYAVAAISTVRITGYWLKQKRQKTLPQLQQAVQQWKRKDPQVRHLFTGRSILSLQYPDRILYQLGRMPGLYLFKLVNRGYYDHRHHTHKSWERRGCKELYSCFTPKTRVVAFGFHPRC